MPPPTVWDRFGAGAGDGDRWLCRPVPQGAGAGTAEPAVTQGAREAGFVLHGDILAPSVQELTLQLGLAWNSGPSCLCRPIAGVTDAAIVPGQGLISCRKFPRSEQGWVAGQASVCESPRC
jgi:hypothetical protein